MTATSQRPTRTVVRPAVAGQVALWGAVLANVVIVEALFLAAGPGKNPTLTVAKFFGLHVALLMMLQLVLVARLPWLDRRIGMDRLTSWHRWIGIALFWTVLLHASTVVLGYSRLGGTPLWPTFKSLAGVTASLLGMFAAGLIVAMVAVSLRWVRRRLQYETWHALHLGVYGALVLGLIHQALETTTFRASTFAAAYWWTVWALVIAALVAGRLVLPLWRNARHRFRVSAVVPESDNVVSVHVSGRNLDRLPARAGQFFIWRFPGHRNWWLANPFSLSAAPDGQSLRLTAKAVGTGSAGLRDVKVGTRVIAEGPYGAFTSMHRTKDKALLIAGGVGITPIRALLEETDGPVVVLYRARTPDDAVLLGELQALGGPKGAEIHLLTGRTADGNPFDPERLRSLVPDIADRDVYVCGPPAMTNAVLRSLRALKLPRAQVHAERFSLAS